MSFAELKRRLRVGVKLKLVRHDWARPGGKLNVGDVREIAQVQSNAIAFATPLSDSGLSWLYWGKADQYRIDECGFDVALNPNKGFEQIIRYEFVA
jgi:hypothetical protein